MDRIETLNAFNPISTKLIKFDPFLFNKVLLISRFVLSYEYKNINDLSHLPPLSRKLYQAITHSIQAHYKSLFNSIKVSSLLCTCFIGANLQSEHFRNAEKQGKQASKFDTSFQSKLHRCFTNEKATQSNVA